MGLFTKLLSSGQDKLVKQYWKDIEKINALEPKYQAMGDEEIIELAKKMREECNGKDKLDREERHEALALCREHIWRSYHQRAFDVQLIATMALDDGYIAESATGSGKTLISRFAVFLNVLRGVQVHVITVNEYLAKRDAADCRTCIGALGVSVGLIYNMQNRLSKKKAYECDVVYGTPSEFGFDYLRDNMVTDISEKCQEARQFAIVDEADSIMIDEARTPLIISGAGTKSIATYQLFARAVRGLIDGVDFEKEDKHKSIACSESGLAKVENALGIDDLYAEPTGMYPGYLQCALKAEYLYHRDKDYIVSNGEVKIVDEFTGRVMEGRRWSEGLHQAIEAKEGVAIKQENQTIATITLQNFFRLYDKLSGMTGTAMTEDAEFQKTYKMRVVAIPPNKPVIREDADDLIYRTEDAKFDAVVEEIATRHAKGQPILVGTVSVEMNEKLSRLLRKRGIKHTILNAKHHEQEAAIVAQAGRRGAVTIATNMAGRGTDIILGGNPEGLFDQAKEQLLADIAAQEEQGIEIELPDSVFDEIKEAIEKQCSDEQKDILELGGLCVIGTERHTSRRIDNQLRGRSGRQGDPGFSQFYISLQDELMRNFGQDKLSAIDSMLQRTGLPDDVPIHAKMVTKAIENAQHTVEGVNAQIRKNTLEYDDVMNLQRKAIYGERDFILTHEDVSEKASEFVTKAVDSALSTYCSESLPSDDWDWEGLVSWYKDMLGCEDEDAVWIDSSDRELADDYDALADAIEEHIRAAYDEKREAIGDEEMASVERRVMLRVIDVRWMEHLAYMDHIKSTIGLRGYGQRDPLVEYRAEAFKAFKDLVGYIFSDYVKTILRMKVASDEEEEIEETPQEMLENAEYSRPHSPTGSANRDFQKMQAAAPFIQIPEGAKSAEETRQAIEEQLGEDYEVVELPIEIPVEGLPEDFTVEDLMEALKQMDLSQIEGLEGIDLDSIQIVPMGEDMESLAADMLGEAEDSSDGKSDDGIESDGAGKAEDTEAERADI